jgi:predicted nucleic acid-binding protein
MRFADTNIFLRAITGDDPVKGPACADLFRRVALGEEVVTTCEAVITEVVYVLSSRGNYGLGHAEVRARLAPLLRLPGLHFPAKQVHLDALDVYAAHAALDFEDALCVAHMRHAGIEELLSYDTDFDRLGDIRRVEPR